MERGNHTFIVKPSDDVISISLSLFLSLLPFLRPNPCSLSFLAYLNYPSHPHFCSSSHYFSSLFPPSPSSLSLFLFLPRLSHPSLLSSTLPVIISLFLCRVLSSFHLTLPYKALPHTPMSHTPLPLSTLRTPQATHHGTHAADTSASPSTGEGAAGEES